jgi:hypothetical protein
MTDLPITFLLRHLSNADGGNTKVISSHELPALFVAAENDESAKRELALSLLSYVELVGEFGVDENVVLPSSFDQGTIQHGLRSIAMKLMSLSIYTDIEQIMTAKGLAVSEVGRD